MGDHHGRAAERASPLVRATDEIFGQPCTCDGPGIDPPNQCRTGPDGASREERGLKPRAVNETRIPIPPVLVWMLRVRPASRRVADPRTSCH
jgi:hypothetical protein